MCYSGRCSREYENGGTCREVSKCTMEEMENDRLAALHEIETLRNALSYPIGYLAEEATHAVKFSVFAEVRECAERLQEAIECFQDEFQHALGRARASLGA